MIKINPRLAIVVVASMLALSLPFGILFIAAGHFQAAKYFLLFALMMALVIALGATIRADRTGTPLTVTTTEDFVATHGTVPATRIRYARRQFVLLLAVTSSCALFCILAAVEIHANLDDEDFPGASIACGVVGLFFASFGIAALLGRLRSGEVLLSTRGVTHHGWCFDSRLDWSAIVGSTQLDHEGQHVLLYGHANADWHRRYHTRIWRIEILPTTAMIDVDCRHFDADPRALYAYLSYYVETPAARHELGTEAALTRAREMNLPR